MNIIKNILKIEFVKNVLTVFSGMVFAQGVYFVSSIVLARLYSPEQFSVFALFFSSSVMVSQIATFKYEHAIIIEPENQKSRYLVVMCLGLSLFINGLLALVLWWSGDWIIEAYFSTDENMSKIIYFTLLGGFLISVQRVFQNYCNRKAQYKKMVSNKIIDASTLSLTQIGLGLIKKSYIGLISGFVVSKILSLIHFFFIIKTDFKSMVMSSKKIKHIFLEHKRFPLYSLPGETIGTLSTHLPVLTIGAFFGGHILGNYSMMERVLSAPVSLISRAFLDVFKQKASSQYQQQGHCSVIYLKTSLTLVCIAIVPAMILFLYAPELFQLVFGEKWIKAGQFAQVLSVLFFFNFVVNPMTYMFYVANKQNYDAIWQILLFGVTAFSIWRGFDQGNIYEMLYWYSGLYSGLYLIAFGLCYRLSKGIKQK